MLEGREIPPVPVTHLIFLVIICSVCGLKIFVFLLLFLPGGAGVEGESSLAHCLTLD